MSSSCLILANCVTSMESHVLQSDREQLPPMCGKCYIRLCLVSSLSDSLCKLCNCSFAFLLFILSVLSVFVFPTPDRVSVPFVGRHSYISSRGKCSHERKIYPHTSVSRTEVSGPLLTRVFPRKHTLRIIMRIAY